MLKALALERPALFKEECIAIEYSGHMIAHGHRKTLRLCFHVMRLIVLSSMLFHINNQYFSCLSIFPCIQSSFTRYSLWTGPVLAQGA
jgi:hypothetical protein